MKQLVKKQDPIDIISSEEEIIFNKPLIVKEDPYNVIIQELKDQEEWMADFVRQTKPKKKLNKKTNKRKLPHKLNFYKFTNYGNHSTFNFGIVESLASNYT